MIPRTPLLQSRRPQRVSLACAQCRGRHIKCDGLQPVCSRCQELGIQCNYQKSRRGGRPRKPAPNESKEASPSHAKQDTASSAQQSDRLSIPSHSASVTTTDTSPYRAPSLSSPSSLGDTRSFLLDLYFSNFHPSHPCVLPFGRYEQKYQQYPEELESLDLVLQFIGSLYSPEVPSDSLEQCVQDRMSDFATRKSGYNVQALILYSTAVYWRKDIPRSRHLLDLATDMALGIGLHLKEFTLTRSEGDAVLAESWRRTWWQLYLSDEHIVAITHHPTFRTSERSVRATVELPCEEDEYDSGDIPLPRRVEEYENREFVVQMCRGFSSFAHFIGLARIFDRTILGYQRQTNAQSKSICINADCAVKSWLTLLPEKKRRMISEEGDLDILLFQAMLMVPVYVVDIHRALSTLLFDKIEAISQCAPPPPPDNMPATYRKDAPIHTSKILHSIEAMLEMMLLPLQMMTHSPWVICMISSTLITYLSACKHVFHGEKLRSAREKIKVGMGALSQLAEVWPRAVDIHREVKIIARELLGLGQDQYEEQTPLSQSDEAEQRSGGNLDVLGDFGFFAGDWSVFENDYTLVDRRTDEPGLGLMGLGPETLVSAYSSATSSV